MSIMAKSLAAVFGQVPPGVIFMDAGQTLESLRARAQEIQDASQQIVDAADAEGRDLTEAELRTIGDNRAAVERIAAQIQARESLAAPAASAGRRSAPDGHDPQNATRPNSQAATVPATVRDSARGGFRSFGEFAACVYHGSVNPSGIDNRLRNAATTYGNEGTGADGGFAVPPVFREAIWQKVMAEENLLTRCAPLVTSSNNMTIPKDETTPWQTSGGVQVYWEAEAGTVTGSKPALGYDTMRLHKLMALVPLSDELLEDAPGLESWLLAKAPAKMASKINTSIVRGTGAGQPLGILNAGCLISIAKETSQVADTVYFANITKMWSQMYAPCRRNAIWLINQDTEPQLLGMAFDPAASSKVPVYIGPNGLSDSPYATLMGRPVVPIEACSTVGDQGDIILADMSQYWALTKGQGPRQDVSMHLYFDQGLTAYRFTFRVNGQPAWGSSIAPENGSNNRSCFVTLDARS